MATGTACPTLLLSLAKPPTLAHAQHWESKDARCMITSGEKPDHADQMGGALHSATQDLMHGYHSKGMHSRPVMSAGLAPEVDASAGCAPPATAYFFSQAQPEETPVPEGPSPPPALPPPAAMLVRVGMVPLVGGGAGSGEVLVMLEEGVSMVDWCALLLGFVSV